MRLNTLELHTVADQVSIHACLIRHQYICTSSFLAHIIRRYKSSTTVQLYDTDVSFTHKLAPEIQHRLAIARGNERMRTTDTQREVREVASQDCVEAGGWRMQQW
jgi:hypothetical protein